jgi:dehydrogenase/reductase SDR family protein 12
VYIIAASNTHDPLALKVVDMKLKSLGQFLGALYFYSSRTPSYTAIGYLARRLFWARGDFDFQGQTWLITGASGGLGRAATIAAAAAGAQVIAVARNAGKLEALLDDVPGDSRTRVTTVVADLSLQSEAQRLAKQLPAGIDVLINNVGVLLNQPRRTSEGHEASFVTNLLSHYVLTEGLIQKRSLAVDGVVINVSSGGLYTVPLAIHGLNITAAARYDGKVAYAYSKRGQVALTEYWRRQFGPDGLRVYTMHPGWARTQGVKDALPVFWRIQNLILRTPRQGIDTALWLAASRPAAGDGEVVWFDRKPRSTHAFSITRRPLCSVEEFVTFLDTASARRADSDPGL